MDTRQSKLLNLVIENYIDTAEPVGSRFLLSSGNLDCGEATVRNELRELEEQGYLTHPHTSAGRIPTEKGYRYYVDNINKDKIRINKKENDFFGLALKKGVDYQSTRKNLAKSLAELSNAMVIMAFSPDMVYYTGLANLFSQPEFRELELVANVSQVFDHCEECLEGFFDKVNNQPEFYIGLEQPFGEMLSVVASKFNNNEIKNGLVVLLAPQRMDYQRNYGLIKGVVELL